MSSSTEALLAKLQDYNRFIGTLLVISSYFYIGALIQLFIKHGPDGIKFTLLSLVFAGTGYWFYALTNKIRVQIDEEERA